jgi:hypothetical protein
MALTSAQQQEWLTEDNFRIVLIDLQYYHPVNGLQMLRISSYPYVMPIGDSTIDPIDGITIEKDLGYDDIISNVPNIVTRLDSDETIGAIDLLNTDGEYDWLLNDVTIVGHKLIVYIGDNLWIRDNFIPILEGVVSGVTSTSPTNIQLLIRDKKESLNVPLQGQVIDTTYWANLMDDIDNAHTAGGFQGTIYNSTDGLYDRTKAVLPEATKDTHVPICLGKCFNIEPVLVDSFNHIYFIHDSDEGIAEVTEVRSNGIPLLGPNPRSMTLTDASPAFIVGDIITDNNDIRISGRIFKTEGTAPAQTIYYYPADDNFPFTGSSGTFTANIDSEPEMNNDYLLLEETRYDLITFANSWTWSTGKLSVNQTLAAPEYISINYQDVETTNGAEYVIKIKVENFVDGGTGAGLKVWAGYAGATSATITANGEYQFVLTTDNTGRPVGADTLLIESNRGTVSLTADVTLWSVKELNTGAAQATAVAPIEGGDRIHSMALGSYSKKGGGGFFVGEVIIDNNYTEITDTNAIWGTVTGFSGSSGQGNYILFYTPNSLINGTGNDFSASTGLFRGYVSGSEATAVNPVILNTGSTGQYEVDLNLGVIRLLDHAQGTQITCDVTGQNGRSDLVSPTAEPTFPYSASDLIEWILLEKAGISFIEICQETFPYTGSKAFDNLASLGVFYKEEVLIVDAINFIANSVGGYLRFKDTACKLQLYKFIDPIGEIPDLFLVDDDIIENGVSLNAIEEPKYALTIGYQKNWKTQDEGSLAGAIADASSPYYSVSLLNEFKNEYSTIYKRLTAITLDEFPLAEDAPIIETAIFNESDAQEEIDRRAVLRGTRRRIIRVQSLASSFTYDIGDVVHITHNRFGLTNGKNALIISMEENPTSNRVTLDLWL